MTSPETQKMIDNLLGNQVQIQASLSIVVEELRHTCWHRPPYQIQLFFFALHHEVRKKVFRL